MREFFINSAERLIGVFVVLAALVFTLVGLGGMVSGVPGGPLMGFLVIAGGLILLLIAAGLTYVAFGIYRNTQEANRILAETLRRQ
ncbi:MAG: hypothetical protein Q4F71_02585 [Paracoccus sp. (in: a-proteobacteria)]|nr:hypothetical protein [Paracoccus sp. (in: a-proteobacteria)]